MGAAAGPAGSVADRAEVLVLEPGAPHACRGGAHTRVADGRRVCWQPVDAAGDRYAVDAELAGQAVPPTVARRLGTDDPALAWPAWTRAEACAKVFDVPIIVWLSRFGAPPLGTVRHGSTEARVVTAPVQDLILSFACGSGPDPQASRRLDSA